MQWRMYRGTSRTYGELDQATDMYRKNLGLSSLALACALPYTLVYLKNLWAIPHYQFFPLLLGAFGYLLYSRLDTAARMPKASALLAGCCLLLGLLGTFLGTLFASPWMGYFGFMFSCAGWLGSQRDKETGGSLLYLSLPLFLIWQPPYNSIINGDTILIQKLQTVSTRLSSQWLDILGFLHFQPGTVLEFAGKSFGVAEACSGVQSFFAVLCIGALMVVFFRRGFVHSILLLCTSPLWAVLMNTTRITTIPVAYSLFGIDLSHGFLHDLLGYVTMAVALGLMLSADELLLRLGNIPALEPIYSLSFLKRDTPKSFVASRAHQPIEEAPKAETLDTRVKNSHSNTWLTVPAYLCFAGFFCIQCYDVYQSWGVDRTVIDFFRDEPMVPLRASDGPAELAGWKQVKYEQTNRSRGNDDLGQRSDMWKYKTPMGTGQVSFDQMFPGWHELTRCYRNAGWKPGTRIVIQEFSGNEWPIVTVELKQGNEYGYLIFSECTRSGQPLQPAGGFTYWTILQERLVGRLTPAVRGTLFGAACYQMQFFVSSALPLTEEQKTASLERFVAARGVLWEAAVMRMQEWD